MAAPITSYLLTDHARSEIARRGLGDVAIGKVLKSPEQRQVVRPGREVLQSRFEVHGRMYLVRVFVDTDRDPAEVVTAYRTSKIDKYWRREP